MSEIPPAAIPPAAPAPAAVGITRTSLGRVISVLWRPRPTFEAIAARPTWAAAMLVTVLASALSAAIWIPSIDVADLIRERLATSGQSVDAARIDSVVEFTSRLRWVMFLGPVIVFQPIALAVVAFVFYLVFRVTGSEQRYQQSLAVTVHAFLPLAVAALLSIPLLLWRGSISTEEVMSGGVLASNLSFLAPEGASPAIHALLQSFDFFSLWSIVLLGIGYSRSTRLPPLSVAISVVAMWVLWILARVGMASAAG